MIFITHPDHGADNINESDLAEREKAGWRVTTRVEWMGKKHPSFKPADPVAEQPVRNKPGRKPKGI